MTTATKWGALALLFTGTVARAEPLRHPSDCGDGCMMVTAYMDHGGHTDWACGGNTYGGHPGTDFGIYGGFGSVDEGRAVVASEPGTVVQAHDGEFDRCTSGSCAGGGGFGNHVAIEDADGVVIWYGHMRFGSISVGVGDVVGCGQFLGFIASSGYSTGPHLHFEPRAPGSLDPFGGPCSGGSMWRDQRDYNALPGSQCDVPNAPPVGHIDGASCTDGITGWTLDGDTIDASLDVVFTIDGPVFGTPWVFVKRADIPRDDLCAFFGSCPHSFNLRVANAFRNGAPHTVFAYGMDSAGGTNTLLEGSGMSFTCDAPALPAEPSRVVLRHVPNPDVMVAWQFGDSDIGPLAADLIASLPVGAEWADAPRLVIQDGGPAIYLVDRDGTRRWVTSPESMAAWRLPWNLETLSAEAIAAMPEGEPLPTLPLLVGSPGGILVVDVRAAPPPDQVPEESGSGQPGGATGGQADHGPPSVEHEDGPLGCGAGAHGSPLLALLLAAARRRSGGLRVRR